MRLAAEEWERDPAVAAGLFVATGAAGYFLTGSVRGAFVTGACIGVMGIGIALAAIREFRKALASCRWPSAPGRVSLSRLQRVGRGGYGVEIHVDYQVNGQSYTCKRFAYGPHPHSRWHQTNEPLLVFPSEKKCPSTLIRKILPPVSAFLVSTGLLSGMRCVSLSR